jgi:hypothetical protein
VAGLQPGDSYSFGVAASSATGRTEAHLSFETQPLGACAAGCPYKTGVSLEAIELGRLLAEGAPAREAARQQAAREQTEREAALAKADQPAPARPSSAPATAIGGVALAGTSVTVQNNGTALVKLTCLGVADCRGKLTLTAQIAAKAKGVGEKRPPGSATSAAITIGAVGFSVAGDETKTVRVVLNAAGRALLRADHGRLSASLALLEQAPGAANTQMKAVRLVQLKTTMGRKR